MNLKKLIYQKLIEPIIHSKHSAVYKARGVAVGLGWAMTPLVGVQMPLVALTWMILKKFKYHFSLPLALAWTWVTNVVTLAPVYYVFYITGQIMRFNFNDITGYQSLENLITEVFISDIPFLEQLKAFFNLFFIDWGISMFLGCVPWVIVSVFLGYRLTLRFEEKRNQKKVKG